MRGMVHEEDDVLYSQRLERLSGEDRDDILISEVPKRLRVQTVRLWDKVVGPPTPPKTWLGRSAYGNAHADRFYGPDRGILLDECRAPRRLDLARHAF